MITAYRVCGYNYEDLPYISPLYLRSNTVSIWERNFEPYLDPHNGHLIMVMTTCRIWT